MEYNYNRREVYMPEKYHISKRHIQLTPKENIIFNLIWSSEDKTVTYQEISKAIYNDDNVTEYDKASIGVAICRMRKKGIKIKNLSGWGYKLEGGKRMNREDLINFNINQRWRKARIIFLEEQIDTINRLSSILSDMPKGSRKVEDSEAESLVTLLDQIKLFKKEIEDETIEMEDRIKKQLELLEPKYGLLLYHYYILGHSIKYIGKEVLHFELKYVYRLKDEALDRFDKLNN